MAKKLISLLLALIIFVSALPMSVFADSMKSSGSADDSIALDFGAEKGTYIPGDVNGDGAVNGKDVTLIRRKNAGYDVELLPSTKPCDHEEVIDEAVLPACTSDGLTEGSHCAKCNKVLMTQTVVPAIGHDYIWIIDKEATQNAEGMKHDSCYICGDVRNENTVIPVATHTHTLEKTGAVAATCTEDGHIAYWTCSGCGKIYKEANGAEEISASETTVKAMGHVKQNVEAVEPTCTEDVTTAGSYCGVCGLEFSMIERIPATGHSYVNEVCTKCGDIALKVFGVSVDKPLIMANEDITFLVETNKEADQITITADIYLDGVKVASFSDKGSLKYTPVSVGRYDAEVSVTDGDKVVTVSLKDYFDVKAYWSLKQVTANTTEATLGQRVTFAAETDGDASGLMYEIVVYKNGEAYYTVEGKDQIDFYPNKTWEIVRFADTGIVIEPDDQALFTVKSDGKIIAAEEGNDDPDGGYGEMYAYYYKNGEQIYILERTKYCVIKSGAVYETGNDKTKFTKAEKEYIVYAMDLVISSHYIKMPFYPDWNYGDDVLNNIVNLSENLAAYFQGKWNMAVEESKRTLSAFIRDYIEERTPDPETATQMMAESVPALIDWLIEAVKELKDLSEFPETVQKAIKTVLEFSEAIKNGSATQSQLSTVIDSLHLLVDYDNNDLRVLMRMSDKCVNWIKAYGVSLESAKYTLRTIKKASIKMTKMLTVLNAVDIGFDTFMYMVADYSVNIEILLLLRAQMEKSYDPDDYELRAINEMISEYEDKYQTAVKNLLGRILAEGTIAFAQKAPGFGLILQVAKWGASASSSPAKADLISFLMITSAAGGLLNDPYNLYNYGTITAEFEMMKKRVSVYLSMVLYANNLAVQVKDKDYPNTDQYRTYNSNMIYKFSEYIYAPVNF